MKFDPDNLHEPFEHEMEGAVNWKYVASLIGLFALLVQSADVYMRWKERQAIELPEQEKLYCREVTITDHSSRYAPGRYEFCTMDLTPFLKKEE